MQEKKLHILSEKHSKHKQVPSDSSVGGRHQNWGQVALQCTIQEGKALQVQHMNLINEQNLKPQMQKMYSSKITSKYEHMCMHWSRTYPGDDLSLAFFPPLINFGINLLTDFWLDLPRVTRKQSQETMCATVDYVDLM